MKTQSQYYFDLAKKSDVPSEIAKYMRLGFEALKKEIAAALLKGSE